MANEQSLIRLDDSDASTDHSLPTSRNAVVVEAFQIEAWNALYREHQRFRAQIGQLTTNTNQFQRAYHQLIINFNIVRNNLDRANKALAGMEQERANDREVIAEGGQQLDEAYNALNMEMDSRIQAEKSLRQEVKKGCMLLAIITRLEIMTPQDVDNIFEDDVDVHAILDGLTPAPDGQADRKAEMLQTSFALKCYKDLLGQHKRQNEELLKMVKSKETELDELKAHAGYVSSDEPNDCPEDDAGQS